MLVVKTYIPDFTLRYQGKTGYLEHLGMLRDKAYKKSVWTRKEQSMKVWELQKRLGI